MRWRQHLAKHNFQVVFTKGPHDTHADALSRLENLAETTADVWDVTALFPFSEQLLEYTETSNVADVNVPRKLRYKHNRSKILLQRQNDSSRASAELHDMAQTIRNPLDSHLGWPHIRDHLGRKNGYCAASR